MWDLLSISLWWRMGSLLARIVVGDDTRWDETEESDGGDDNCDDETLLVETPMELLVEPAISCLADADDDEPCRHVASSCTFARVASRITGASDWRDCRSINSDLCDYCWDS